MKSILPTKKARVIAVLLAHRRIHRFDIERIARDHVPNSTIAELRRDGLEIATRLIQVPGYGGAPARIAEYELAESSREKARELLQRDRGREHG